MPKLIITHGDDSREVPLKSGDTLGRVASNAIQLKVAEASRKHCEFTEDQGVWWVEDLGSSNGTLVNGRRVTKFELQDGDVIQVGIVSLRFLMSEVEEEPEVEWGDDDISLEEVPYLVLLGAGREGDVLPILEGRLTIGRKARHAVQLKDISVSGDHAELVREGDTVTLRDLGSSNGTFVGGRQIKEVELVSGDQVRFGTVAAKFDIGDPSDAEAAAAPKGDETALTQPVDMGAIGEDATFELHDLPKQKEAVWNILAIVLILGLGGGAWWLMSRGQAGGRADAPGASSPAGNMIPIATWSFEPQEDDVPEEDLLTWERSSVTVAGEVEEVATPVLTGLTALAVSSESGVGPPSVATLNKPIQISGGQPYKVSVSVSVGDDQVVPCLEVRWLEDDPRRELNPGTAGIDRVHGPSGDSDWTEFSGIVTAPSRARFASIGVGVSGAGRAVFDNVSMVPAMAGPGGAIKAVNGFQPVLGAQGSLRLYHFGRPILDGVGVVVNDGKVARHQAEMLWVSSSGDGAVAGSLRGGRGDLRVAAAPGEGLITISYEGQGLQEASSLVLPLAVSAGDVWQVTLVDGEIVRRFEEPFDKQSAAEVILGVVTRDGSDMVKIRLLEKAGVTTPRPVSLVVRDGRPIVHVGMGDVSSLGLEFRLSFEEEERQARELLSRARSASSRKDPGRAIKLCEEVMTRFPFVSKTQADASTLRDQLLQSGRDRLRALTVQVDDAIFFKTLASTSDLVADLLAFKNLYQGTLLGPEAENLWKRFGKARSKWSLEMQESQATRVMARAQDYMKTGKDQLALVFFTYITDRLKDSEWAEQAEQFKQAIRQRSGKREKK